MIDPSINSPLDRRIRPALQVVIIGGAALAIRLVYLWQIHDSLAANIPLGDAASYDTWARELARGDWIGTGVFYQAPLYPYLLGVIYAMAGHSLTAARLAQAVMGAAGCVFLMLAGRRFVGPGAGLIAGLMLAFYAPAIFFDGLIQKASLDTLLVCLLLWTLSRALDSHCARSFLWSGLALGGLMLTRENTVVLAACALAWAAAGPFPGGAARRAKRAGLILLGMAVVLAPVAVRNKVVGGEFHLSTSQFGPNFYIGNNPASRGVYMPLRLGRGVAEHEREDATDLAQQALGRKDLTPGEVSDYWAGQAFKFIRRRPGDWLRLMGRKGVLVWSAGEIADTEDQETYAESSPVLRVLERVANFGVLFPLACAGVVLMWGARRRLWVLYAIVLVYAGSVALFYVFARYRMPLVPPLMLLAGGGLAGARDAWRAGKGKVVAAAAAMIVAGVLAYWPSPVVDAASFQAITHTQLGVALAKMDGRLGDAVAQYRRAIELDPDYAGSHYNLGVALMRQGNAAEAAEEFGETIKIWPDFAAAHSNLGLALSAQGDLAGAVSQYRIVLTLDPNMASAHNNLGAALARQNKLGDALVEFRKAVELEPKYLDALQNQAKAAAALGLRQEAAEACRKVLAIDPRNQEAMQRLKALNAP